MNNIINNITADDNYKLGMDTTGAITVFNIRIEKNYSYKIFDYFYDWYTDSRITKKFNTIKLFPINLSIDITPVISINTFNDLITSLNYVSEIKNIRNEIKNLSLFNEDTENEQLRYYTKNNKIYYEKLCNKINKNELKQYYDSIKRIKKYLKFGQLKYKMICYIRALNKNITIKNIDNDIIYLRQIIEFLHRNYSFENEYYTKLYNLYIM